MAHPVRTRSGKTVQWREGLTVDTEEKEEQVEAEEQRGNPPHHPRTHGDFSANSEPRVSRAAGDPAASTLNHNTPHNHHNHYAKKAADDDVTVVVGDASQGTTTSHQAAAEDSNPDVQNNVTDALGVSDSWGRLDDDDDDDEYWAGLRRREGETHLQNVDRILFGMAAGTRREGGQVVKLMSHTELMSHPELKPHPEVISHPEIMSHPELKSHPEMARGRNFSPAVFQRDLFLFSPTGSVKNEEEEENKEEEEEKTEEEREEEEEEEEGGEEDPLLQSGTESELAFDQESLSSFNSNSAQVRKRSLQLHPPPPPLQGGQPLQHHPPRHRHPPSLRQPQPQQPRQLQDAPKWPRDIESPSEQFSRRTAANLSKPGEVVSKVSSPTPLTTTEAAATEDSKSEIAGSKRVPTVDRQLQTATLHVDRGVQTSTPGGPRGATLTPHRDHRVSGSTASAGGVQVCDPPETLDAVSRVPRVTAERVPQLTTASGQRISGKSSIIDSSAAVNTGIIDPVGHSATAAEAAAATTRDAPTDKGRLPQRDPAQIKNSPALHHHHHHRQRHPHNSPAVRGIPQPSGNAKQPRPTAATVPPPPGNHHHHHHHDSDNNNNSNSSSDEEGVGATATAGIAPHRPQPVVGRKNRGAYLSRSSPRATAVVVGAGVEVGGRTEPASSSEIRQQGLSSTDKALVSSTAAHGEERLQSYHDADGEVSRGGATSTTTTTSPTTTTTTAAADTTTATATTESRVSDGASASKARSGKDAVTAAGTRDGASASKRDTEDRDPSRRRHHHHHPHHHHHREEEKEKEEGEQEDKEGGESRVTGPYEATASTVTVTSTVTSTATTTVTAPPHAEKGLHVIRGDKCGNVGQRVVDKQQWQGGKSEVLSSRQRAESGGRENTAAAPGRADDTETQAGKNVTTPTTTTTSNTTTTTTTNTNAWAASGTPTKATRSGSGAVVAQVAELSHLHQQPHQHPHPPQRDQNADVLRSQDDAMNRKGFTNTDHTAAAKLRGRRGITDDDDDSGRGGGRADMSRTTERLAPPAPRQQRGGSSGTAPQNKFLRETTPVLQHRGGFIPSESLAADTARPSPNSNNNNGSGDYYYHHHARNRGTPHHHQNHHHRGSSVAPPYYYDNDNNNNHYDYDYYYGAEDPDKSVLRKSLRELSAKIQLQRLEAESRTRNRSANKPWHFSADPSAFRSSAATVKAERSRIPAPVNTSAGRARAVHENARGTQNEGGENVARHAAPRGVHENARGSQNEGRGNVMRQAASRGPHENARGSQTEGVGSFTRQGAAAFDRQGADGINNRRSSQDDQEPLGGGPRRVEETLPGHRDRGRDADVLTGKDAERVDGQGVGGGEREGDDWDWMADVDAVDIQEEYGRGDTYVFYLQTDDGNIVGPLKFDVEGIDMGLPVAPPPRSESDTDGMRNRQTGSHGLNEFSSRSHSVLTVTIDSETQPDSEDDNLYVTKRGKLSFVDLAGSEKVKDASGGFGGPGMLESNSINKSLLVLGNCISHLGDAKRRQGHIPYRDSKLTKLLSDSLGGNGITLMIACITPSSANTTETMNTLRYASRAKKIKSKPTVKMDPREKLIVNLKREIKVLRNENHYLRQQLDFPAKPKGQLQKENDEKFMKFMKEQKEKESGLYEMLQEYMVENESLRAENSEMHSMRDRIRREQQLLYRENEKLMKRVEEMERVMSQNPAMWAARQAGQRTDGYGQYDLTSPRASPVAPGYLSGTKQLAGSPPGSRGKGNPPGPMKPPHRLPDPVMRPVQRPAEIVENGAVYPASNGYASPRAGPRQTSPTRQMERKASQVSTTDAINSMNEQLKREVMQLEGQIRHHQYIHERTSDVTRTSGNSVR